VQLHFAHAEAGKLLPSVDDAKDVYHGGERQSQLERLLKDDVTKPFNGSGSMRPAFTIKSAGWSLIEKNPELAQRPVQRSKLAKLLASPYGDVIFQKGEKRNRPIKELLDDMNVEPLCGEGSMQKTLFRSASDWDTKHEEELFDDREGERLVLLDWVAKAENGDTAVFTSAYDANRYDVHGRLEDIPLTKRFVEMSQENGKQVMKVHLKDLLDERCAKCHYELPKRPYSGANRFPLESAEQYLNYCSLPIAAKNPPKPPTLDDIYAQREGERRAVVSWIEKGAKEQDYERDRHELTGDLEKHPVTEDFVVEEGGKRYARVQAIFQARCVRCHRADAGGPAAQYPLDSFERIKAYTHPERSGAMSLPKLAQTTHVHLLGFSMLFAITGLIFTFTSYPLALRLIFGPFTLLAQIADISCWWLGRADPNLARLIAVTGGLVAMGLIIQVVGSLFNMFGRTGKLVVTGVLIAGAILVAVLYFTVISHQLKQEAGDETVAAITQARR
jgi:hypothetical protein